MASLKCNNRNLFDTKTPGLSHTGVSISQPKKAVVRHFSHSPNLKHLTPSCLVGCWVLVLAYRINGYHLSDGNEMK